MNDMLDKLKLLLEGALVEKIEPSSYPESLCKFVITKSGKRKEFVLYATDLGNWVGNYKETDKYIDIKDMMEDIYNHNTYICDKTLGSELTKELITIFCGCGEQFSIFKNNVLKEYLNIINNEQPLGSVTEALSDGAWIYNAKVLKDIALGEWGK